MGKAQTLFIRQLHFFVDCNSISGTCVAFPDMLCDNANNEYFIVKEVHEWPVLFEQQALRHQQS